MRETTESNRRGDFSLAVYLRWPLVIAALAILMNIVMFTVSVKAAKLMLIFTLAVAFGAGWLFLYSRKGLYAGLVSFAKGFDTVQNRLLREMDIPAAVTDLQGRLLWRNTAFRAIIRESGIQSGNITSLFPDITREILETNNDAAIVHSSLKERKYSIEIRWTSLAHENEDDMSAILEGEKPVAVFFLTDETDYLAILKEHEDQQLCQGLIYLDNYDEALAGIEEVRRSLLTALVDRKISNYIRDMQGVLRKLEKDKYYFIVMQKDLDRIMEDRFSVLEDVKTINIGNELSLTLSIGVGQSTDGYGHCYEQASAAIDLALGRGGDQAVVKNGGSISYFGGKAPAAEKVTRVKARVKAQALRELLESKESLLIMGHKIGDVDSLGAAVGFWRIAVSLGKKASIVLGVMDKTVQPFLEKLRSAPGYREDMFVDASAAGEMLDAGTVVVVVDTSRRGYSEVPELISRAGTLVVVDHHRRSADSIDNAALSYIEPYASSASELTAEIIQYISDDPKLTPQEANLMYAGIVIDTQNFMNQTGVRTFEAAAFLKRKGADVVRVRKMLRNGMTDFKAQADGIEKAEIYRNAFALSFCDPKGLESPTVVGSKIANSLLGVDGIKAAVVMTPYNGRIYISARSIDEVNVQVMMEKLGGGGHKAVAGAQLADTTPEEARAAVIRVIDEMIDEGEVD